MLSTFNLGHNIEETRPGNARFALLCFALLCFTFALLLYFFFQFYKSILQRYSEKKEFNVLLRVF